jgi:hypothetical protein
MQYHNYNISVYVINPNVHEQKNSLITDNH